MVFSLSKQEAAELARDGELKVAVAVGPATSAVWCVRDPATGKARGVTVSLAEAIARNTGLALRLVEFESSGDIVQNANDDLWTLSFVPIDSDRREKLSVGPDYYLGVSTYLTRSDAFQTVADVDHDGVRVAGVAGTATFRSAERSLKRAKLTAIASLDEAMRLFTAREIDALALGKESILSVVAKVAGTHAVAGHFHEAGTAIVVPRGRPHALAAATRMIEELKRDGTVRAAFDAVGMTHADVAPPRAV
ncbi:transporter substrate-binding domain-containing protein [Rhizobium sp. CC-YZS058]|uniref:transporter substrate-binding domain-containing protein n=1 Tax=Rhizobium sp. CC-YZS058 TaxID=3042153 RepID=UPI002B05A55A|nr:transporter substrate-binding domain-containing protein [Rhizobium sp. CC-YZS058]MEA3537111.1 transporter substrate-binding domain-containing protein [Rhizobium sp. CC-YZS058]